jgi:hypothetical protein
VMNLLASAEKLWENGFPLCLDYLNWVYLGISAKFSSLTRAHS